MVTSLSPAANRRSAPLVKGLIGALISLSTSLALAATSSPTVTAIAIAGTAISPAGDSGWTIVLGDFEGRFFGSMSSKFDDGNWDPGPNVFSPRTPEWGDPMFETRKPIDGSMWPSSPNARIGMNGASSLVATSFTGKQRGLFYNYSYTVKSTATVGNPSPPSIVTTRGALVDPVPLMPGSGSILITETLKAGTQIEPFIQGSTLFPADFIMATRIGVGDSLTGHDLWPAPDASAPDGIYNVFQLGISARSGNIVSDLSMFQSLGSDFQASFFCGNSQQPCTKSVVESYINDTLKWEELDNGLLSLKNDLPLFTISITGPAPVDGTAVSPVWFGTLLGESAQAAPEPQSLSLLCAGILAWAGNTAWMRRRRNEAQVVQELPINLRT